MKKTKLPDYLKKIEKSLIFTLNTLLFVIIIFIFFYAFSHFYRSLTRLSRTSGITYITFISMFFIMQKAYGGYDIGKKKSKPIIYSMSITTILADVITYFQLSMLNPHVASIYDFRFLNFDLLISVIALQVLFIYAFTYLGNYLYFEINAPERTLVVYGDLSDDCFRIDKSISKFKRQFQIVDHIHFSDTSVLERMKNIDTVVIGNIAAATKEKLLDYCYKNEINALTLPKISNVFEMNGKHVVIDDVSYISSYINELSIEQRIIKRLFDLFFSILALFVFLPIGLVIAIAIKLDDGGPIFYRQPRATLHNKKFIVYKFRSMKPESAMVSAAENDVRITRVGRFIRKARLDEIPQLYNILKGEMSIVGPRPEMLENYEAYGQKLPEFFYRLRVKGGLTGYAQVLGKYNTTSTDKLILDLMYIENYSIFLDFKIMLQTLLVFFKKDSTEGFHNNSE